MVRFMVVGRREEPTTRTAPSTAPGMPGVAEQGTSCSLLMQSVDEEGKTIRGANNDPMGGSGTTTLVVPVASLASVEEFVTGSVYELREII